MTRCWILNFEGTIKKREEVHNSGEKKWEYRWVNRRSEKERVWEEDDKSKKKKKESLKRERKTKIGIGKDKKVIEVK